jgi:hypothetical protein
MTIKGVIISIIDPTLYTVKCGGCGVECDGQLWSTDTDTIGNNWGRCPICYHESLLINADEVHESSLVDVIKKNEEM